MEDKKEVKEKKEELSFKVGNVVTETAPAVFYEGNPISQIEAIALILNKLEQINKKL